MANGVAGAPVGNNNGGKGKRWANALERALAHKYKTAENGLLEMAKIVIEAAASGEREALQEIANRMDGKPHQSSDMTLSGDLTIRPIDYSQTVGE